MPDIQSESEMISNGVYLQELTIKLLQKVEELTLYTIEQEKRIAEQEMRIKQLEQKQIGYEKRYSFCLVMLDFCLMSQYHIDR